MSYILTAIGVDAAVDTNFITINLNSFHDLTKKYLHL
jgi:hypothetical protein